MAFTTQGSLLSAIRRGDEIGWVDFHNTYKRLIAICGKEDYGLNPNEVDELIQLVMIAFFRKSETFVYDRSKARFSTYLKGIIRHRALDLKRRQKRELKNGPVYMEPDNVEMFPDNAGDSLDLLLEQHALESALEDVKSTISPETYQVFHAVAIEGLPIEEAAGIFGKSANTIYGIKCRVMKKLKSVREAYDE